MNCEYCGKEEALPFVCNYCGGVFCGEHRLPEAHQCKGDLTQRRTIVAPPQTTFTWSNTPSYQQPAPRTAIFSRIEVRDIIIAWLGLSLAFSLALSGGGISVLLGNESGGLLSLGYVPVFLISAITVGSGFVMHELMHKFVAQRHGFWAEFRMWPLGLVLALVTSLLGFIFAAPGATYISGTNITDEENGIISFAGPLTNVVVAALFVPVLLFATSNILGTLGFEGVFVNVFLALFNMLPVMPLDGAKVFRWSKARWTATFVPLAAVFVFFLLYL